jgi:predicted nucleic acid-binding protein
MAEVAYMLEVRIGGDVLTAFLLDLEEGAFTLDCGENDLSRVRALISRYRDLPLGYADAAVIACAERTSSRVLTFDLRHFLVVAGEDAIEVVGFENRRS